MGEGVKKLLKKVNGKSYQLDLKVDSASEKINNGSYDLIISYLRKPGKVGFELLTNARKINKQIMFIILTNYALEQYENKAKEIGVNYSLSKADDLQKIVNIMNDISDSSVSE